MRKFWKIRDSKFNKLIFIKDKTIYKGNPKQSNIEKINLESSNVSFLENLFSIPYSYIKRIENQTGKDEIKIYYGNDSEDEIIVKDRRIKQEIFDYLKDSLTEFKYSSKLPNIINYAKAQFFSLLFITSIFLWSLYIAIQIESGVEYEIVGRSRSIAGIVLFLANLGIVKNVIGFAVIISIIIFSLVKRLKTRSEMEILER